MTPDILDSLRKHIEDVQQQPKKELTPQQEALLREQIRTVCDAIDKACPDSPVHPDSMEFLFAIEDGESEEALVGRYYIWAKQHLTKTGGLRKKYEKEWFSKEILCPSCNKPLNWRKEVGFNNHRSVDCQQCNWGFRE